MAKRSNQKAKLLYLSKILLEHTDEQKGLTLSQIISELARYGIETGRKSLYDDIEHLRLFGYDVRTKRDRYVRYYIAKRNLEPSDFKIISDGIYASRILTDRKKEELVRKVGELASFGDLANVLTDGEESNYISAISEDAYKNLSMVCRAMRENKKIIFRQFEWNSHKQRIIINNGAYITLSPWRLQPCDGGYGLLGFDSEKKDFVTVSVERMVTPSITSHSREGEEEFFEYSQTLVGGTQNICLKCANSIAGELFERFGMSVTVLANREEYFEAVIKAKADGELFAWLFSCKDKIEILSPDTLTEEYFEMLRTIYLLYL